MHQCPADEKFGDLYSFDHDDSASFLKTNALLHLAQNCRFGGYVFFGEGQFIHKTCKEKYANQHIRFLQ